MYPNSWSLLGPESNNYEKDIYETIANLNIDEISDSIKKLLLVSLGNVIMIPVM
jgi:hypothetical protein